MSRIPPVAPLLLFAWLAAPAQDFQELQKKITDFTLPNGMRFVVAERHAAPMVAARVYIGAGSIDDPPGQSGMARLFERIPLTGTEGVGSRDGVAERKALDAVDDLRNRIAAERSKGLRADEGKIATLGLELTRANSQAVALGNPGEYTAALQEAGIGWSIAAGADSTTWDSVVPSHRIELWFLMQSQALDRPSFRRFYDERDDLANSWRARVENAPFAAMMATLPAAAFLAHPYRKPVQGWGSDLAELRLADARRFFDCYWTPNNITIALAGDITAEDARRMAERYFGPIPARPLPPPVRTQEPEQRGPRTVVIDNSAQAMLAVGFRRPDELDRDDVALDVVRSVLVAGRNGWLQHDLVDTKRLAASVQAQSNFPGGRYPSLFVIAATAAPGHTAEELENAVVETIARLRNTRLDDAALDRARALTRMAAIARLADNAGIAGVLARATAEYGDWRKAFEVIGAIDRVTADQAQLAALKYLTPSRMTSVRVNQPRPAPAPGRGGVQ